MTFLRNKFLFFRIGVKEGGSVFEGGLIPQCMLIPPSFVEILLRYCTLLIFGNLGISGYSHQKRRYQLVENFVYLHANNQIHPSPLFPNIAKIFFADRRSERTYVSLREAWGVFLALEIWAVILQLEKCPTMNRLSCV